LKCRYGIRERPNRLRIITPLYNAERYVERMINSVLSQTYKKFQHFIYDDMSTDNSVNIIKSLIKDDDRFHIITNKEKMYSCGNHYQLVNNDCKDLRGDTVCITLDGDDWFADEYVLERVLSYYSNKKIKLTFGQFLIFDGKTYHPGFTKPFDVRSKDVRTVNFTFSHLRTFRFDVFRRIKKEDLISPSGSFWEIAGDLAIIYPMIETVGTDKIFFSNDTNYIYNVETNLNEHKVNMNKVHQYTNLIKSMPPYKYIWNI